MQWMVLQESRSRMNLSISDLGHPKPKIPEIRHIESQHALAVGAQAEDVGQNAGQHRLRRHRH